MSGWIKLHRSLLEWEWFDDHNATRLLIFLLISVNHEDKKWKGVTVKAGSMIFSWETLSNSIGLTIQQVRSAMKKLESSREVNRQSTNQYQIITLVKWDKMQSDRKKLTGNQQQNQQTDNKRITTTKEEEEYKEEKTETGTPSLGEVIYFFDSKGYDSIYASKVFEWYQYRNWEVNGESILKKWRFQMINQWMKSDEGKKSDKPKFKDLSEFIEAQNGMDTP